MSDDEMSTCRIMETRTCPPAGPCAGPCARFESDDPSPWLSGLTDDQLRTLEMQTVAERRSRECPDFLPGHRSCDQGAGAHDGHGYTMWHTAPDGKQRQVRVEWTYLPKEGS